MQGDHRIEGCKNQTFKIENITNILKVELSRSGPVSLEDQYRKVNLLNVLVLV